MAAYLRFQEQQFERQWGPTSHPTKYTWHNTKFQSYGVQRLAVAARIGIFRTSIPNGSESLGYTAEGALAGPSPRVLLVSSSLKLECKRHLRQALPHEYPNTMPLHVGSHCIHDNCIYVSGTGKHAVHYAMLVILNSILYQ